MDQFNEIIQQKLQSYALRDEMKLHVDNLGEEIAADINGLEA